MASTKAELRRQFLQQRQALSHVQKMAADRLISERTIDYLTRRSPRSIHLFKSLVGLGEIDTTALRGWAMGRGIDVYSTLKLGDNWRLVRYITTTKYVEDEPAELDVIIVPLLAFDHNLHRLGYGGGYYDGLSRLYGVAHLIGVGYDFQRLEVLPSQPHDVSLDTVITDQALYKPPVF